MNLEEIPGEGGEKAKGEEIGKDLLFRSEGQPRPSVPRFRNGKKGRAKKSEERGKAGRMGAGLELGETILRRQLGLSP